MGSGSFGTAYRAWYAEWDESGRLGASQLKKRVVHEFAMKSIPYATNESVKKESLAAETFVLLYAQKAQISGFADPFYMFNGYVRGNST